MHCNVSNKQAATRLLWVSSLRSVAHSKSGYETTLVRILTRRIQHVGRGGQSRRKNIAAELPVPQFPLINVDAQEEAFPSRKTLNRRPSPRLPQLVPFPIPRHFTLPAPRHPAIEHHPFPCQRFVLAHLWWMRGKKWTPFQQVNELGA